MTGSFPTWDTMRALEAQRDGLAAMHEASAASAREFWQRVEKAEARAADLAARLDRVRELVENHGSRFGRSGVPSLARAVLAALDAPLPETAEPTHEYQAPMWSGFPKMVHATACVRFIKGATTREDRICYERPDHPVHRASLPERPDDVVTLSTAAWRSICEDRAELDRLRDALPEEKP